MTNHLLCTILVVLLGGGVATMWWIANRWRRRCAEWQESATNLFHATSELYEQNVRLREKVCRSERSRTWVQ
jgi:hypothetical protein